MMKIYVALVLTVSLSGLAYAQRRRYSMTQYREGAARSSDASSQDEQGRYDPRNLYPTSPRTVDQNQYQTSPRSVENYHYETSQRTSDYEQYQTSPRLSDRNHYHTTARSEVDYYDPSPRTVEVSNHYPTNSKTVEVSNHYPTNPRSVDNDSPRNKYRRKPKQTYYPKVVSFYQKPTPNNGYEFKYVTADGVQRAERGYLSDKGVWTVEGSVTSLDDDNVAVVQSYIADGAGYKSSVRRHSAGTFRSLDDFLPWAYENEGVNVRLADATIRSLVG